ncbi:MAG: hypothetical protein AB1500_11875 [Bacillota bacterium]
MPAQDCENGKISRSWVAADSKDNAEATATKAAVTGAVHFVSHVSASFSGAATKLLQIKDDVTIIFERYIVNAETVNFSVPLKITSGKAVSAVLAASGTAGVIGKVNLAGFTV